MKKLFNCLILLVSLFFNCFLISQIFLGRDNCFSVANLRTPTANYATLLLPESITLSCNEKNWKTGNEYIISYKIDGENNCNKSITWNFDRDCFYFYEKCNELHLVPKISGLFSFKSFSSYDEQIFDEFTAEIKGNAFSFGDFDYDDFNMIAFFSTYTEIISYSWNITFDNDIGLKLNIIFKDKNGKNVFIPTKDFIPFNNEKVLIDSDGNIFPNKDFFGKEITIDIKNEFANLNLKLFITVPDRSKSITIQSSLFNFLYENLLFAINTIFVSLICSNSNRMRALYYISIFMPPIFNLCLIFNPIYSSLSIYSYINPFLTVSFIHLLFKAKIFKCVDLKYYSKSLFERSI